MVTIEIIELERDPNSRSNLVAVANTYATTTALRMRNLIEREGICCSQKNHNEIETTITLEPIIAKDISDTDPLGKIGLRKAVINSCCKDFEYRLTQVLGISKTP